MKMLHISISLVLPAFLGEIQALSVRLTMSGKAKVACDYDGPFNQFNFRVFGGDDFKDCLLVSSFFLDSDYQKKFYAGCYKSYPGMEDTIEEELGRIISFLQLALKSESPLLLEVERG